MAITLPRTARSRSLRSLGLGAWSRVVAAGARLNGTAVPIHLDAADRAELERTIFG